MLAKRRRPGLLDALESINDDVWSRFFPPVFNQYFSPASDLTERNNEYQLKIDAPGLDDIKVLYENEILNISGKKTEECEDESTNCHWKGRTYGEFQKSYHIPAVNEDGIVAKYSKGVLTVTLSKVKESQPPRKEITVEYQE